MNLKQIQQIYSLIPNETAYKTAFDYNVFSDNSQSLKIHSAIWKFYLLIFPNLQSSSATREEWMPMLERQRKEFLAIREKFILPKQFGMGSHDLTDPLINGPVWDQYFEDSKLKQLIKTDTARLFQDEPFFQDKQNIKKINLIIFLHLRCNPEYQYKQGFHELCGIIFYVLSHEMTLKEEQLYNFPKKVHIDEINRDITDLSIYQFLFSHQYLESDAFFIYSAVIRYIEKFYEESNHTTIISEACYNILQVYMKRVDVDVSLKLTEPNLSILMYQWLRILFGRIFSLNSIKYVWSVIFAFYPNDQIVSTFSIALILSIKQEILETEEPFFVMNLFKIIHFDSSEEIIKSTIDLQKTTFQQKFFYPNGKTILYPAIRDAAHISGIISGLTKEQIIEKLIHFRDALVYASLVSNTENGIQTGGSEEKDDEVVIQTENPVPSPSQPMKMPKLDKTLPKAARRKSEIQSELLLLEENELGSKKDLHFFSDSTKKSNPFD